MDFEGGQGILELTIIDHTARCKELLHGYLSSLRQTTQDRNPLYYRKRERIKCCDTKHLVLSI